MKRSLLGVLALASVVALPAQTLAIPKSDAMEVAAAPAAAGVDAKEWSRLAKGEVVVREAQRPSGGSKRAGAVEARVLIAGSPEQVYPAVMAQPQLMRSEPKVKKIRVLSRSGNHQQLEYTVTMSRLLPTFQYVLQMDGTYPREIRFHRVSGSFNDVRGFWRLTPVDQGRKTLLTYNLYLDPGALYPNFLVNQVLRSDLPSMMRNVRSSITTTLAQAN